MIELLDLPLSAITESTHNPRKHFNADKMAELVASVQQQGVLQPILVRPLPGIRVADTARGVTHEIIAGARRYRASVLAGRDTIPAVVRHMDDAAAMEAAILENLQRDDLTELEEAEGYEALMQHSSLTADQVGAKIGKSRSYVYGRLKLLDLGMECKQALREGTIDASRALLIARIPDTALQIKALAYAAAAQAYTQEVPSVRLLQDWLKKNVMLKLEHAVFKITDTRLVEAAGSCTDCPKRTGANPDLFADVDGADICTDPACYHGKEEAHRAQLIKKAEAKGMRIVEGKEALEMLEGREYRNLPFEYTSLADRRPDCTDEGDRPATLGQLLGADAPAPILFVHPRTQVITELVPTEEAEAVLLAKGLIKVETQRAESLQDLEKELAQLQSAVQARVATAVQKETDKAVACAIHISTPDVAKTLLTGEVLRAFLLCELDEYGGADEIAQCARYEFADGVDETDAITAHLQRMGDTDLLRTTAHFLLNRAAMTTEQPHNPVATVLAKVLGVDTRAIEKAAQAATKADYAQRIKDVQKQIDAQTDAQKANPATGSAARPQEGAGGQKVEAKDKAVPVLKKASSRAAKLSAQEATQGIAAAMQGIEGAASAPDGAVALPAEPAGRLAIGASVKITDTLTNQRQMKFAGKKGTITGKVGVAWDVTFKGRTGGISSFTADQLKVVPA